MKDKAITKTTKKTTGWNYFSLGLYAFAGLGAEVIYAYFLEPKIYGAPMQEWTQMQIILHWVITCATWGFISFLLIKCAVRKYGFHTTGDKNAMKPWQRLAVVLAVILVITYSCLNWGGLKILKEYQSKGMLLFVFQYIYYAFETVLFTLIILFGQKAFEIWFRNERIPYGGILCGLTWGLAHAFTKSSLSMGLYGVIFGFILGTVYLLVNRDIRKTYILLFLMFVM